MPIEVVCLRPEADFARVGALPPPSLAVRYCGPADAEVPAHLKTARALVIPAVGSREVRQVAGWRFRMQPMT